MITAASGFQGWSIWLKIQKGRENIGSPNRNVMNWIFTRVKSTCLQSSVALEGKFNFAVSGFFFFSMRILNATLTETDADIFCEWQHTRKAEKLPGIKIQRLTLSLLPHADVSDRSYKDTQINRRRSTVSISISEQEKQPAGRFTTAITQLLFAK